MQLFPRGTGGGGVEKTAPDNKQVPLPAKPNVLPKPQVRIQLLLDTMSLVWLSLFQHILTNLLYLCVCE